MKSKRRSDVIFFSVQFSQKSIEIGVSIFPKCALFTEPALGGDQVFPVEHAGPNPPLFSGGDQMRIFENADVLHEGWESHAEGLCQLTYRCGAPAEPLNDGPARRIGERVKNRIQGNRIVSHAANYRVRLVRSMAKFRSTRRVLCGSCPARRSRIGRTHDATVALHRALSFEHLHHNPRASRRKPSNLHQVPSHHDRPAEMAASGGEPFLVRHVWVPRRDEVRKYQHFHARCRCDLSGLLC